MTVPSGGGELTQDQNHGWAAAWSTTEKPCSCSAARMIPLSLRTPGSGMENIGRSVRISVRLLERSPPLPMTARASAQCYLAAPDKVFLAILGSSLFEPPHRPLVKLCLEAGMPIRLSTPSMALGKR